MKNLDFLKKSLIVNSGIYDNEVIYENTKESFEDAINNKYQITFNLNMTKDNVIIIYNDEDLTRLLNLKDKINSITYEELNYLSSYKMLTLEEGLRLINGKTPVIINIKHPSKKHYLEKEVARLLCSYKGEFAILSKSALVIRWFNKNHPNFIIGEVLTKSKVFSLINSVANCIITTDFKSININYYDVYKIKKIKENSLVLGYLINDQEKYEVYKDVFDNLIIDNLYELKMMEEIL